MSGCNVRRGFCLEHQCWTDEVRCRVSYLAAEVERLTAERDALQAQVQRVWELHKPTDDPGIEPEDRWCVECERGWDGEDWDVVWWPCRTIAALGGGSNG